MLGVGEQLRDQDEQDDLARGVRVRPRALTCTQGHQEQGGEFAPQRPLAYGTHARRPLPRLLALVLARGAGRARACSPTSWGWTRCGSPRRGDRTRSRCSGCSPGKTERVALGSGLLQIPARQPTATAMAAATLDVMSRRALPARPRRVRPAGLRGLVRRAVRPARRAHARVRGDRAHGARPRRPLEYDGREWTLPLPGRARPAAEAAGQAGAGADPDLPRRRRPEGGRAGRRDRRRLAAVHARPASTPTCCSSRCDAGSRRRAARGRTSTSRPCVPLRGRRRRRRGARRRPAVAGLLPRRDGLAARRTSTSSWPTRAGHGDVGARGARSAFLAGDREGAAAALTDELIDAMAHRDHARPGSTSGSRALRGAPASTRSSPCRCGRTGRRPCARWRRRSAVALAEAPRAARRGSPAPTLTGPWPVGTYAAALRERLRELRARAGVRRGVSASRPAARRCASSCATAPARCRARCGARTSTRSGIARRWPTARRSWRPAAATTTRARAPSSPSFSFAVDRPARGRRGRPAGPARAAAPGARTPRACSSRRSALPRPRAAAHDRRRHRRARQGARRRARRAAPPRLGRAGWCGRSRRCRTATPRPAITRALQDLAACAEVDVIVVARGGGSLADLFAFCDETLCRTVALLRVPVIAVGRPPHRPHADRRRRRRRVLDADARRRGRRAGRLRARPARRWRRTARAAASARAAARSSSAPATLARLSRAPAEHVARHRARLHQQLRELRAQRARRAAWRDERAPTPRRARRCAARAQGARPRAARRRAPSAARELERLRARARRARPAAHARARLRARRGRRRRAGHQRRGRRAASRAPDPALRTTAPCRCVRSRQDPEPTRWPKPTPSPTRPPRARIEAIIAPAGLRRGRPARDARALPGGPPPGRVLRRRAGRRRPGARGAAARRAGRAARALPIAVRADGVGDAAQPVARDELGELVGDPAHHARPLVDERRVELHERGAAPDHPVRVGAVKTPPEPITTWRRRSMRAVQVGDRALGGGRATAVRRSRRASPGRGPGGRFTEKPETNRAPSTASRNESRSRPRSANGATLMNSGRSHARLAEAGRAARAAARRSAKKPRPSRVFGHERFRHT